MGAGAGVVGVDAGVVVVVAAGVVVVVLVAGVVMDHETWKPLLTTEASDDNFTCIYPVVEVYKVCIELDDAN